jgi:hypothetical protein
VVACKGVFDKITGITPDPKNPENSRIVEFDVTTVTTRFNDLFPSEECKKESPKGSAFFRKYDDGWRLVEL